jgi:hypothetical protein
VVSLAADCALVPDVGPVVLVLAHLVVVYALAEGVHYQNILVARVLNVVEDLLVDYGPVTELIAAVWDVRVPLGASGPEHDHDC